MLVASKSLRALMDQCGYTWADMARLVGSTCGNLKVAQSLGWPHRKLRLRIEAALGTRIFSPESVWKKRQEQKKLLGIDPAVITKKQLRAIAKTTGCRVFWTDNSKPRLLETIVAHLAVNPQFRPPFKTK